MSVPQLTRDLEAPLQVPVDDADRLAEWPELVGLEDLLLDNGQLPSHLADRPYPQELHVFPDDVSAELLHIINQPLEADQPTKPPVLSEGNGDRQSQLSSHSLSAPAADGRSSTPVRPHTAVAKDPPRDILSERCLSPESASSKSAFGRTAAKPSKEPKNLKSRLLERNSFRECASCFVELLDKNLVPLGCMHKYCLGCFSDMIVTAMKNESKFPPKCCLEDIPTKLILHNVDSILREEYKWKIQEYSIPRASRCCFCGARGGTCGCAHSNQQGTQRKADAEIISRDRAQLAAIIAEDERTERREVEERLRKEDIQKLQEEEGQRRQDEGRRRVQHDKEIKRLISISHQIQRLQGELAKINKIQQSMIITRHQNSAERIQVTAVSKQVDFDQMRIKLEKAYESNFKLRKGALEVAQSTKTLELLTRQEEDEDDNFVQMQRHLKGKPNREERERAILDRLNASHKKEQEALEKAHKDQLSELEYHGSLECSALQSGIMKKLGDLQRETNYTLYELSSTVISDRRWFKIAIEKRYGLLEEHRMFLINGPDAVKVSYEW
ncbi:IBR domain-containing protein [Arthroderma uncinatum]|uniref:IBR domain-containing protein n=1 Tax=Arthroderma uncinatum TaxID=74035 RepID=UPI00144A990A|nr:IBR domain-containing protein [Arthroderma uncinatum]KAF3480762.1 IBR domain-containing protein [Arthroderma uncinatum]